MLFLSFFTFVQKSMKLVGEPSNSHGYMVWTGDTAAIEYYRYAIHEVNSDTSGTTETLLERGEIWGQNYLYIRPQFWRSDQLNGKAYSISIQGVDASGLDLNDEIISLCSGCPGGFVGCNWQCISSHYAFRIQQNGNPDGGPNSFRYQMEEARDESIEGVSTKYYEWFDYSGFSSHISNPVVNPPAYRGMPNYDIFDQLNQEPYFMISFPPDGEVYRNGWGHIIQGDVYGIKKGMGQWHSYNSHQTDALTADYCALSGQGQAAYTQMENLMNNELDPDVDFFCSADLGQGVYVDPDEDYEEGVYLLGTYFGDAPLPDYGDGNGDGDGDGDGDQGGNGSDGGIVIDEADWEDYVARLMNFENDAYNDTLLRYSEMLMDAQLFNISKVESDGYESFFTGNYTSFADQAGVPSMPTLDFEVGLYKLTFKRTGYQLFYGLFEVRNRFQATLPHKDFFSATIYPNPNANPHFFIDIVTTACLSVRYEIFDGNGNILYSSNMRLPKDHNGTHRISPDPLLPNGFLYHRFSFGDGSYETLTTIKN
jgi:hypothetical protein